MFIKRFFQLPHCKSFITARRPPFQSPLAACMLAVALLAGCVSNESKQQDDAGLPASAPVKFTRQERVAGGQISSGPVVWAKQNEINYAAYFDKASGLYWAIPKAINKDRWVENVNVIFDSGYYSSEGLTESAKLRFEIGYANTDRKKSLSSFISAEVNKAQNELRGMSRLFARFPYADINPLVSQLIIGGQEGWHLPSSQQFAASNMLFAMIYGYGAYFTDAERGLVPFLPRNPNVGKACKPGQDALYQHSWNGQSSEWCWEQKNYHHAVLPFTPVRERNAVDAIVESKNKDNAQKLTEIAAILEPERQDGVSADVQGRALNMLFGDPIITPGDYDSKRHVLAFEVRSERNGFLGSGEISVNDADAARAKSMLADPRFKPVLELSGSWPELSVKRLLLGNSTDKRVSIDALTKSSLASMTELRTRTWRELSSSQINTLLANKTLATNNLITGMYPECKDNCIALMTLGAFDKSKNASASDGPLLGVDFFKKERFQGRWRASQESILSPYSQLQMSFPDGKVKQVGVVWMDQYNEYVWFNYPASRMVFRVSEGIDPKLSKVLTDKTWVNATIPTSIGEQLLSAGLKFIAKAIAEGARSNVTTKQCPKGDCFNLVRQKRADLYEIECIGGQYTGQKISVCRNDAGRWAYGCGTTAMFAYHYDNMAFAANRACGK